MTVEEKREILRKLCVGNECDKCELRQFDCCANAAPIYSIYNSDEFIEKVYLQYAKLKGDKAMEERTITITTHEYKGLVADQAILAKLEVYTETHEFLNADFIRTLLGTTKPSPARIESEGD